jgi:hypothetical protein
MKIKLLSIFTFFISYAYTQVVLPKDAPYDKLIDFGKPLYKANAVQIGGYFPSCKFSGDYTAIIADYGQLNSNGTAPVNCFKVYFIDVLSQTIENVPVKDINGNTITTKIGGFSAGGVQVGLDNCYYLGTTDDGGGHLIRINYKDRTVTDLGVPHNFTGAPNLTTLALGTDLSLNGVINPAYGGSAYTFRYDYECGFKELDTNPVDLTASRTKKIGADATHQYVICQDGDNYKLIAINRQTFAKNQITLSYGGNNLNTTISVEIESYVGDYVYARVSNFNGTGTVVYWKLKDGQVLGTPATTGPNGGYGGVRVRTDQIWYNNDFKQFESTTTLTPVLDNINYKLYYKVNNNEGFVDLSGVLLKEYQTTQSIAPYLNANSNKIELFVGGAKYSMASSLKVPTAESQYLGVYTQSMYATTSDFDNTNVWMAGYPTGVIEKYNSTNAWNLLNSINSPTTTSATTNPQLKYYTHLKVNDKWGPLSIAEIKKISPNILIAGGTCAREYNHLPVEGDEIGLSIIRTDLPDNSAITNVYDPVFNDYVYNSMDVSDADKLIFIVGKKRTLVSGSPNYRMFILNIAGTIVTSFDMKDPNNQPTLWVNELSEIRVFGKTIYFIGQYDKPGVGGTYCILKIADYTISTTPSVICSINGLGSFAPSLGLSLDGNYLWADCNRLINDGTKLLLYMPTSINNDIYDATNKSFQYVKMVEGDIPPEGGAIPGKFAYIYIDQQGYVLYSGHESIYGFKPSQYQGVGYSQKVAPGKSNLKNTQQNKNTP